MDDQYQNVSNLPVENRLLNTRNRSYDADVQARVSKSAFFRYLVQGHFVHLARENGMFRHAQFHALMRTFQGFIPTRNGILSPESDSGKLKQ